MGRPRIYAEPRVTTAVRLSETMRDQLQRVARRRGLSVNQLVVAALSDYLGRQRPEPPARP